jgi:hypothetical protein
VASPNEWEIDPQLRESVRMWRHWRSVPFYEVTAGDGSVVETTAVLVAMDKELT